MEASAKKHLGALVALSQDNFLAALDAGLRRFPEKRPAVERPSVKRPYYTLEGPKEAEEDAVEAMCAILELVWQQRGDAEEGLATLLTTSGLQEDRTRLLLAQYGTLVELSSSQKQCDPPPEDLVDLQWKLGVVAGSSDEGEAGRTFIQVNFITQPCGRSRSAKLVEMSLEKFYDFLHQLEKCRRSLEYSHPL